jgi:hypothetical protein
MVVRIMAQAIIHQAITTAPTVTPIIGIRIGTIGIGGTIAGTTIELPPEMHCWQLCARTPSRVVRKESWAAFIESLRDSCFLQLMAYKPFVGIFRLFAGVSRPQRYYEIDRFNPKLTDSRPERIAFAAITDFSSEQDYSHI